MYDYNCPDCNETKLQTDKNARKINEVIDQVNALIQVNNETVNFIEEKVEETAEIKVNEVLGELNTKIDNILSKESKQICSNVMINAHGGFSGEVPENTISAFEVAGLKGFDYCECDLVETGDNNFVCLHEDDLSAMTNGTGLVSQKTLNEIKEFNIVKGNGIGNYQNEKIPTIEEYLTVCKKHNLNPYIEIKNITHASIPNLIDIIINYVGYDFIIGSFDEDVCNTIIETDKNVKVTLISSILTDEIIEKCKDSFYSLSCDFTSITKELIEKAHKNNLLIAAWTVNNKNKCEELLDYGCDMITTDTLIDITLKQKSINIINEVDIIKNTIPSNITTFKINNLMFEGTDNLDLLHYSEKYNLKLCDRLRSRELIPIPADNYFIKFSNLDLNKYKITMHCYDKDGYFIRDMGWFNNNRCDNIILLPIRTKFIIPYFGKNNDEEFWNVEVEEIKNVVYSFNVTDRFYTFNNWIRCANNSDVGENLNDGINVTDKTRVLSLTRININSCENIVIPYVPNGWKVTPFPLDKDDKILNDFGWKTEPFAFTLPINSTTLMLYCSKIDNTTIEMNGDDINNLNSIFITVS